MGKFDLHDYAENFDELEFDVNNRFSKSDIQDGWKNNPLVSYYSIDLGKTDYHFNQDCFTNEDIKAYFSILNEFSNITIGKLFDLDYKYHLKETRLAGKLLEVYKKYKNVEHIKNLEDVPAIFHFGLYTTKTEKANRDTGIKSPRIYFMIGSYGVIHILFYDPYHEINPTSY